MNDINEDIRILEEFINDRLYKYARNSFTKGDLADLDMLIGSLIKGYKLEKLKNVLDEQSLKETLEDYIPKSKIKEKIEELKREFDFFAGREHAEWQDGEFDGDVCDDLALKISVLQELMEDK